MLKEFGVKTVLALCLACLCHTTGYANEAVTLITQAGNAEEEQVRYRLLMKAASLSELDTGVRQDLQALLPFLDHWANKTYRPPEPRKRAAENGFLCGFFVDKVRPDQYCMPRIAESSPLYPIWCLYRGRMLIHQVIQTGDLRHVPALREAYCGEGRRLLRIAYEAFPTNRVIGMYLDEPIPGWPQSIKPDPRAPAWANLQREGLEKLTHIIHWWIDEQQLANGEFGGGWGDDCEMWRWWAPVMIAFDDPKITQGQERFSQGLFSQPHMKHGYTELMHDVEHTAEDSKDTITPMLHLQADNPLWSQRARRIAQLMRELWTGTNQRGHLQFKSTYFNVHRVHPDAQRACDTVWHPGVVQPTMVYWLRTRDTELTEIFSAWMDTWVDITARADRGKPAGIIPSAIHWPEGHAGGLVDPWYEPKIDRQAHLYNWPGNMTMLTSTLLLTYHITGDKKYLQPIHSMAAIWRDAQEGSDRDNEQAGSLQWCGTRMQFMSETLAKYRALTEDTQYDDLLTKEANGYVHFRLTGRRDKLESDLLRHAEALRINWPAYTSEVRWTDRVLRFASNYANDYARPRLPDPDPILLYASATGDFGRLDYLPLNAVRWLTPPKDIAALVSSADANHFQAELYHFGNQTRTMAAEFYLLSSGDYTLTLTTQDRTIQRLRIKRDHPRTTITIALPPRTLCTLKLVKTASQDRVVLIN